MRSSSKTAFLLAPELFNIYTSWDIKWNHFQLTAIYAYYNSNNTHIFIFKSALNLQLAIQQLFSIISTDIN